MRILCCLFAVALLLAWPASAAKFTELMKASAKIRKYTCGMFDRPNDFVTRRMAFTINRQVAKKSVRTS